MEKTDQQQPDAAANTTDTSSQEQPGSEGPDISAGILEAIDSGIADAEGKPKESTEDDDAAQGEEADDERGGAGAGEETSEGEAAEGEGEAAAGEGDGDTQAGKKAPDYVNDPVPQDVNPRTRKRIESLVDTVKNQGQELEQLRQDQRVLFDMIEATGATAEQWAEAMDFLGASLSEDPKLKKQALDFARTTAERLALELGEQLPGLDLLKNHPDLREAVDVGDITEERAQELARYRDQQKRKQDAPAPANTDRRGQAPRGGGRELTPEEREAAANLNALGEYLAETDPLYARKMKVLLPQLQPIMQKTPPSEWRKKFTEYYKAVKLSDRRTGEPARGRQPAGQQQKESQSMLEAIERGLEEASR